MAVSQILQQRLVIDKVGGYDASLNKQYCYQKLKIKIIINIDFNFVCRSNQTVEVPNINLTMKGGDNYFVIDPIVLISGGVRT